jgi:hypothetical protein
LRTNHPDEFQNLEAIKQCSGLLIGNSKSVAKAIEKAAGMPQLSGQSSDVKMVG